MYSVKINSIYSHRTQTTAHHKYVDAIVLKKKPLYKVKKSVFLLLKIFSSK